MFNKATVLLFALAMVTMTGCYTGEDEAMETLLKAGFTDIKTGDIEFFSCDKHDKYGRGFRAKNPNGRMVEGTVCCGILKSCTVRF